MYAALQYAASFHCLVEEWKDCDELKPKPKEKWTFLDQKREQTKHRTVWCAEANEYRCMRCGRGSKYMKMPGTCTGPKYLSEILENGESVTLEVMIWSGQMVRSPDMVQKVFGICDAKNGTKIDELLQAIADGHQRVCVWSSARDRVKRCVTKGGQ